MDLNPHPIIIDDVPRESADTIIEIVNRYCPEANARLVVEDVALRDLGFKDYAPCRIEMDMDDDAFWKLYDELDEFEQMSYDPNDGSTDEVYCKEHEKELTTYYYLFQRDD